MSDAPIVRAGDATGDAVPGSRRPRLSAVVPCLNEVLSLPELHRRLSAACRSAVGNDYEIVLIDDGSSDGTWAVILDLASRDAAVVGIRLSRNHGHQLALSAGLALCRGARVLVIDADLQDPPELLSDMMAVMDRGADVVYGQRVVRHGEGWIKRATASVFYRVLQRLTDVSIPFDAGDFRLISRRALDVFLAMPEQHRFVRGMVSWIGLEQVPLPYQRSPRFAGTTKYPVSKMLQFALDAVTGFSIQPLRWSLYCGILFALLGVVLLGYVAVSYFLLSVVRGWTSLLTIVLLTSSAQLLLLGIFGEYLGRLYLEAKRRPLFVVREVVRGRSDQRVGG